MAGISNPYLSQIERGLREPSERVIDAIAETLKVSADTLYQQAGKRTAEEGPSEVELATSGCGRCSGARCSRCPAPLPAAGVGEPHKPSRRRPGSAGPPPIGWPRWIRGARSPLLFLAPASR